MCRHCFTLSDANPFYPPPPLYLCPLQNVHTVCTSPLVFSNQVVGSALRYSVSDILLERYRSDKMGRWGCAPVDRVGGDKEINTKTTVAAHSSLMGGDLLSSHVKAASM